MSLQTEVQQINRWNMKQSDTLNVPFADLLSSYHESADEYDIAIRDVIRESAFIGNDGNKFVRSFETNFAAFTGARHVVGCANGTDAIEISLRALEIGAGDEVIVPAMTWISTASAVLLAGAQPVFVDVGETDLNIDPGDLENAITSRTKAVIAVHLYGQPAQIRKIRSICDAHGLSLIEDCAQSHGATVDGVQCGNYGELSTFSFFPSKNLGGFGDAGCVVTNSEVLEQRVRRLRNHGQVVKNKHQELGRNSRLDGIQAALLDVRLRHFQKALEGRKKVAAYYVAHLSNASVELPPFIENRRSVYHQFVIRIKRRDALRDYLRNHNVATGIHYPQILPDIALFGCDTGANRFSVARRIADEGVSLPIFPEMSAAQMAKVVDLINAFDGSAAV